MKYEQRHVEVAIYVAAFLVVLPRAVRAAEQWEGDHNTPERAKFAVAYAGHYAMASADALSRFVKEALG